MQGVMDVLDSYGIRTVLVPKDLIHLFQPLDLTTNETLKKIERREFSEYFTSTIMNARVKEPDRHVITIDVDLKLSTLKPMHGNIMTKIYEFFKPITESQLLYLDGRHSV